MSYKIAALGGDGIGPEVVAEAMKVLDAVRHRYGHVFEWGTGPVGGAAIDEFGTALPEATFDVVRQSDAVLFGAVGGPKWDDPRAKVRPEQGILALRKSLGLFANLRPVRMYPQLAHSSPLRPERLKGVDLIIIRELTGGLYFGKPKKRWETSRGRRAVDTLSYTEKEIERVVRVGFELARKRRRKLHSLDKMNVMESSRLWREIATEVGKEYPDVQLIHMLADNAAMQLVLSPAQFDVIVTENTFGDILSDEASILGGSMGMLPSASLSSLPTADSSKPRKSSPALYEPIHGSAPDIAGKGIANPIAAILSAAMMLRWSFGLHTEADAIEHAVDGVLAEGYRTRDIAAPGERTVGTTDMGDIIAGRVV
ncbi:MAG: 3-isopropylmalate dehydrogenase [SAR202 cluster bacterium]|nr:3-isopropylmalate dehydrogenase [SAR202 cluster bacterium]